MISCCWKCRHCSTCWPGWVSLCVCVCCIGLDMAELHFMRHGELCKTRLLCAALRVYGSSGRCGHPRSQHCLQYQMKRPCSTSWPGWVTCSQQQRDQLLLVCGRP
jgi:hypothetical protein